MGKITIQGRMKTRIFAISILILIVSIEQNWLTILMDAVLGFKWFIPINNFLKENTQGLIVVLLISLFGELVRFDELKSYMLSQNKTLNDLYLGFLEDTSNRALVELALKREYPEVNEIRSLVSNVISPFGRCPFFNCTMTVRLVDVPLQPKTIRQYYTLRFTAIFDEFILAIAKTPLVAETLFACLPSLTEVIILEKSLEDINWSIQPKNFSVEVKLLEDSFGATVTETLEFQSLNVSQVARLGKLPDSLNSSDFLILSAQTPGKPNTRRTFTIRSIKNIQVGRHRYIWMSDRPIFMNTITIDATQFPSPERWDFSLHPFLAKIIDAHGAEKLPQYFELNIDSWVIMGQGVCLTWQKREHETQ